MQNAKITQEIRDSADLIVEGKKKERDTRENIFVWFALCVFRVWSASDQIVGYLVA